jgi:hypothetical protein
MLTWQISTYACTVELSNRNQASCKEQVNARSNLNSLNKLLCSEGEPIGKICNVNGSKSKSMSM